MTKSSHKFQDLTMLTDYEVYFTHVPPDTFKQLVFFSSAFLPS